MDIIRIERDLTARVDQILLPQIPYLVLQLLAEALVFGFGFTRFLELEGVVFDDVKLLLNLPRLPP